MNDGLIEKQRFFDRLSPRWHDENTLADHEWELLHKVLPASELSRGGRVLDLGGGTGRLAESLVGAYPLRCLILDLSRGMLEEGARHFTHPAVRRLQADARRLPFSAESIRFIFCFRSFPHFEQKEEVLRESRRVLISGGSFVILHSCSREEINNFHSSQSPTIASDHLPPLSRFRYWGTALKWIPKRLENGPGGFVVHYRKP